MDFIDELQDEIINMRIGFIRNNPDDFYAGFIEANKLIDSISENARRMLEIGIVQDELMKLGFNRERFNELWMFDEKASIRVQFFVDYAQLTTPVLRHRYPLQEVGDLLAKVRELIEENI